MAAAAAVVDAGFEAQTNARVGELERALRETINKVETMETELLRLEGVGQQLTTRMDDKIREIEDGIER